MGNYITVPFSKEIPGGVHEGDDVVIKGRVPDHATRFSINLCFGASIEPDCALHFNPRFDCQKVVRNHMQHGSWDKEERDGGMPFKKNKVFVVHMTAHNFGYKIAVNNCHFCNFNHRLPKESIRYICIQGDVHIDYILFKEGRRKLKGDECHGSSYPQIPSPAYPYAPDLPKIQGGSSYLQIPSPAYPYAPDLPQIQGGTRVPPGPGPAHPSAQNFPSPPAYPGVTGVPIYYNPPVPFTSPIPGMMGTGRIIFISGIPHPNSRRFTINLQCGPFKSDDIALHFDSRFHYNNDHNQVIRNYRVAGAWGREERNITYFPFYPNAVFEIMILAEPNSFKVAVNNQHFVDFFFQIQPIQRVTHLVVEGDVNLTQVRFQ